MMFKNKNLKWSLLILFGFGILWLKTQYVLEDYRYIPWSFDTSRVLKVINEFMHYGEINFSLPPRVGLFYLAGLIGMLSGIPASDMLLIPLFSIVFLGAGLVYLMAKQISGSSEVGKIAFLFFCIALVIPMVHTGGFYAFIAAPIFWITSLQYLRNEVAWWTLWIASMGLFIAYPPLAVASFIVASIPFLIELIKAIHENKIGEIKRKARFFWIIPTTFLLGFILSESLINPTYRGFGNFMNRTFGLWIFGLDNIYIKILFGFGITIMALIALSPLFKNRFRRVAEMLVRSLAKMEGKLDKIYKSKGARYLGVSFLSLIAIDILISLRALYAFQDLNQLEDYFRPLVFLSGLIIKGDLWNYENISYLPYFFFALATIFLMLKLRFHHQYAKIELIFFPLFFIFVGILPKTWSITNLFISQKAIHSLSSLVYSLAALGFVMLLNQLHENFRKWKILILSMVIIFSVSSSIAATRLNYSLGINTNVIAATQWLEKQDHDNKIFIVYPYYFKPDKDANDQTFYSLSFLVSEIPFSVMLEVNQANMVAKDFNKFERILKKYEVKYLILEELYGKGNNDEKIKTLGEVVYEKGKTLIIKL